VPDVPDVPLVLHDLAVAIGEVRAALTALTGDPRMAYEAATAAGALAGSLAETTALTRGRALIAIRDAEDPRLSTAALAERMGISKTRAAQLVAQAARHGSDLDGRIAAEGGQP
jgi:hypothetical protein